MYEISAAANAEWKEIDVVDKGEKKTLIWKQRERKRKKFEHNQKKITRKSKLREIRDEEKAQVKLESTQ
jgi:hypothetical protein